MSTNGEVEVKEGDGSAESPLARSDTTVRKKKKAELDAQEARLKAAREQLEKEEEEAAAAKLQAQQEAEAAAEKAKNEANPEWLKGKIAELEAAMQSATDMVLDSLTTQRDAYQSKLDALQPAEEPAPEVVDGDLQAQLTEALAQLDAVRFELQTAREAKAMAEEATKAANTAKNEALANLQTITTERDAALQAQTEAEAKLGKAGTAFLKWFSASMSNVSLMLDEFGLDQASFDKAVANTSEGLTVVALITETDVDDTSA